jgi:hypothetical protein
MVGNQILEIIIGATLTSMSNSGGSREQKPIFTDERHFGAHYPSKAAEIQVMSG